MWLEEVDVCGLWETQAAPRRFSSDSFFYAVLCADVICVIVWRQIWQHRGSELLGNLQRTSPRPVQPGLQTKTTVEPKTDVPANKSAPEKGSVRGKPVANGSM